MSTLERIAESRCFEGSVRRYRHRSQTLDCDMAFGVFLPPQAEHDSLPAFYWLSGLTCTDENFLQKAGAQRLAAELGIALIAPDTSPRGTDLPGEHDSYDFGSAAGFYLNATRAPWDRHYRMFDYVTDELPGLVEAELPVDDRRSVCGHSMGGHGALVCALRKPELYRAVSAFAPISCPSRVPWGEKAFSGYLGEERAAWAEWDATELMQRHGLGMPVRIDQGEADGFLGEQLRHEPFAEACRAAGVPLELNYRPGYDHSYYFIASFIDEHLRHHAAALAEDGR